MKTRTRRVAALVAAGALGLGGVAAAPAIADAGPFGQPTAAAPDPGPGRGGGNGPGPGMGVDNGAGFGHGMRTGMGVTARGGTCGLAAPAARGTVTEQQKATLMAMAEDEKLAGDLYAAFAARYPAGVFAHIAAAEDHHLSAVRTLLDRYGLTDPTAGRPAGRFSDPAVQARYDKLLAQGRASRAAALQVGQTVEKADIAGLTAAREGLTAADLQHLYNRLLAASERHLTAFRNWSTR